MMEHEPLVHLLGATVVRLVRSISVDGAGNVVATYTAEADALPARIQPLPGGATTGDAWRVYLLPDATLALADRLTWTEAGGMAVTGVVTAITDVAGGRLRRAMVERVA